MYHRQFPQLFNFDQINAALEPKRLLSKMSKI